jgi:hypothetical protein
MRIWAAALALLAGGQDEKFSGPQKGEKTPPFRVFDIATRQEVDYVAEWKGAPALLVFVHEYTRPAAGLMRALDETVQIKQARGLRAAYVSLSENRDGAERHLPLVAKSLNLKSPLTISVDGKEGPGAYGLNREVTLTVIVARENRVHANFALTQPNDTDAPRIRAAIDEVLKVAVEPPSGTPDELRAEVVRLREQVLSLQEEVARLKLEAQRAGAAAARRMEAPPAPERPREDERLVAMCRRLIQQQAAPEEIEAAVRDIEGYIEGKDDLRKQYVGILTRVLDLKYGNEAGQAAMRKQVEKHRR